MSRNIGRLIERRAEIVTRFLNGESIEQIANRLGFFNAEVECFLRREMLRAQTAYHQADR